MSSQTELLEQALGIEGLPLTPQVPHWGLPLRVIFRFGFAYFGLYCLTTQVFGGLVVPGAALNSTFPDPGTLWPTRPIVFWTARHIFHVTSQLVIGDAGSGDKIYDWTQVLCMLVFAGLATVIWSILDRRRENYVNLYKWFRVVLRFALGSEMLAYGIMKVIPLQMPSLFLSTLVEPVGHLSPMGMLWSSISASPAYEIFAGSAEMLGGALVLIPATATLGALVCLADLTNVFMLNMTYDVPVKLFSFHLLVMAVLLLAPEVPRLVDFFVRNRAPDASPQPALFRSARANRVAVAAQLIFGMYILASLGYGDSVVWRAYHTPRSPLYGIWEAGQTPDGAQSGSIPLRRLIFESFDGDFAVIQGWDDSFTYCRMSLTLPNNMVTLTKFDDKNCKAQFGFRKPAHDRLILDGEMDQHKLHLDLRLIDGRKFLLVSRGFHWVQENPFNR